MGGKKPLRRPLWPPTRATASNYYPLGLDGAGGAAKPLLRAPKKPAPLHGRLPAFSGAVDAFERARKCFLEWRYFFSIILSEFLKNRVALHRGYDLVIDDERHGEIKTCYRVDQLGSCNACGAVVSSLETECAVCRSTSINRKDDSKWLIAIRNNDEFAKLLDPYRYYFVLFEFESIYDSNNNDIIASIWEVDPKSKGFAYCMIDYYLNIRSQSTSKAPFNMWPHMLKFALTEPTLIYRSKITNDGNIITDVFPSKNNTYSDVLLPLSSYSGSTTISVANIKNVIKKYSPSARVNGLNKEKLLQLLEDIRKTNNITNADLCNKFADEIYLPKIVLKKADIPLSLRSQFIDLR